MSNTAYSVHYDDPSPGGDAYATYSIDWDWKYPRQWARSEKGHGTAWESYEGLDKTAYKALLKHFGLEKWAEEFPMEKIISMSPAQLAQARNQKEKKFKLPSKDMPNFTLGNNAPATTYE